MPATCYVLSATSYPLTPTCYLLSAICYLLSATCYLLPAACNEFPALRFAAHHLVEEDGGAACEGGYVLEYGQVLLACHRHAQVVRQRGEEGGGVGLAQLQLHVQLLAQLPLHVAGHVGAGSVAREGVEVSVLGGWRVRGEERG